MGIRRSWWSQIYLCTHGVEIISITAKGCYMANFKPQQGNYTVDGHMVAAKVASSL